MKFFIIRGSKAGLGRMLVLFLTFLLTASVCWASGGEGGHEGGHSGWSSNDWARVLNFTVLASVLFFLLKKVVSDTLKKRISDISDELKTLESRRDEAQAALNSCVDRMAGLEAETSKILDAYCKQGEEARTRILGEAKKSAEKLEAQAMRNIEQEFDNARRTIRDEVIAEALETAEALIKKRITSDDQDRLVDEYLKKVVA